jgi:hypothetical protein
MGHQAIVRQLETILPEIRETRDPEGVMLKYATQENFSPAQLEKLAQVYNIAKTLTFMDKSASRGGSFRVVETEALLARYTQPSPTKKADISSWLDQPEAVIKSAAQDDISAWLDSPYEKAAVFAGLPDGDYLRTEQTRISAESDAVALLEGLHKEASEAYYRSQVAPIDVVTLNQIIFDQNEDLRALFAKTAATVFERSVPFAEVEEDVIDLFGESAAPATAALVSYMKSARVAFTRFDPAAPRRRRLARDRHGLAAVIHQASEILSIRDAAVKFAATMDTNTAVDRMANSLHSKGDHEVPYDELPTEGQAARVYSNSKDTKLRAGPDPDQRDPVHQAPDEAEKKSPVDSVKDHPAFQAVDGLLSKSVNPMAPYNGIAALIQHLQPSKNKGQQKVDRAMHDEHHVSALQRLMVTDPIISAADPSKVVELANTLRSTSPDASRDPSFLRFAIREALQYDGVPSHTYKDLATLQELQSKTRTHELANEETVYGRGKK